jgi:hypothetical protein
MEDTETLLFPDHLADKSRLSYLLRHSWVVFMSFMDRERCLKGVLFMDRERCLKGIPLVDRQHRLKFINHIFLWTGSAASKACL